MKKSIGFYIGIWALLFLLFTVIALVAPHATPNYWEIQTVEYWLGYATVFVAFLAQLACACVAFIKASKNMAFYKLSLITTSYAGLIATTVWGSIAMSFLIRHWWISIIVCAIVLACNLIAILKASIAIVAVDEVDKKVKVQTAFIKSFTAEVASLSALAKSEGVKAECNRLYEAVRFSDPMSCAELEAIEGKIALQLNPIMEAIDADDAELLKANVDNTLALLASRNQKCKVLK